MAKSESVRLFAKIGPDRRDEPGVERFVERTSVPCAPRGKVSRLAVLRGLARLRGQFFF